MLTAAVLGTVLGALWAAAREVFTHWARLNPEEADMLKRTATKVRHEVRGALQRPRGRAAGQPAP